MDGGINNFNVLNNKVFETGCDEVAERAAVRNKGFAAEGKQPCVGTIWVLDDEGWKAKKKDDGNWEFTPIG